MLHALLRTWTGAALAALLLTAPAIRAEQTTSQTPSLYDRLGGLAPITVVVNDFVDVLVTDPLLNANPAIDSARKRVPPPYLKFQVSAMVCQATGGPCVYQGRSMKAAHAHLYITEGEWAQAVKVFKEVLATHQVPMAEQQELLAIVESTKADIITTGP